ncbi:ATP-binding protein [Streptomyces sp. Marseille-Q5077]|uniref:ATP-binding protein n=1 Tax=Streptomyces sp. Marseille-Q5077 TaxID=3418995 RepID=UPI003CFEDD63
MTSKPTVTPPTTATTQLTAPATHFAMRFSSTPRGVRLARRLCAERLHAWGIPYGSDAHDALILIAAELCANAVQHGRALGRDFHVQLTADHDATVRLEVTDTRSERLPAPALADPAAQATATGGRGLLLVEALADTWGFSPRHDGPGKTVWAQLTIPDAAVPTGQSLSHSDDRP